MEEAEQWIHTLALFSAVNLPSSEGGPSNPGLGPFLVETPLPLWDVTEERQWEEGPKHGKVWEFPSQQLPWLLLWIAVQSLF